MKTMFQFFEWYLDHDDHLWKKMQEEASHLAEIGIDYVWLPPAYKGHRGQHDSGYGVYDLYDLGEFNQKGSIETKYGCREDYLKAVEIAQKKGLKVLADVVLNHRLGADDKECVEVAVFSPYNRLEILEEKVIEAWTQFTFPNRKGKYSSFSWRAEHFKGIDYDALTQRNHEIYLFKGKSWDENVDLERANFDYLLGADVDFNHPEVRQELIDWGRWYLETTKVQGFRLDAVKHIQFGFFQKWLKALPTKKDFFVVGEYWSSDLRALHNYLAEESYAMHLFDVPLHDNFHQASLEKSRYDLRNIFRNTLVENQADYAVTFVDNHDTQKGQSLESWVEPWFKPMAYALILLRKEGIPCVFYGDYYGLKNEQMKKVDVLPELLQIRKTAQFDKILDYFDDPECVGWTSLGENGFVVLMSNGQHRFKKMHVGKSQKGKRYENIFNPENFALIDDNGNGLFEVDGMSLAVYREVKA